MFYIYIYIYIDNIYICIIYLSGEDIETAAKREVLEETGIQADFKCLISFRHGHDYSFGCSDIYMIAYLTPQNFEINSCKQEISESKWMKVNVILQDFFLTLPKINNYICFKFIHGLNKICKYICLIKLNCVTILMCSIYIPKCCITVSIYKLLLFFQLSDFMQHPEVHANNKTLAAKTINFLQHQMGIVANYEIHPITKKQICVYNVQNTDIENTSVE